MKHYIGPVLIILSVAWLAVDYFWGLTRLNIFLVLPFLLMLFGVVLHVFILKHDSRY